jgi:hypothetical protein
MMLGPLTLVLTFLAGGLPSILGEQKYQAVHCHRFQDMISVVGSIPECPYVKNVYFKGVIQSCEVYDPSCVLVINRLSPLVIWLCIMFLEFLATIASVSIFLVNISVAEWM